MKNNITTKEAKNEIKSKFIKKFEKVSSDLTPLLQGDGIIKISPFDDYFLFTLFDEKEGADIPIDLSNVGTIFISFVDKTNEIKIPNYTNVDDIDLSSGQVLFRISKENSKKILSLKTRTFYISTSLISDNSQSDESVLYTGNFTEINEAGKEILTNKINEITNKYTEELSNLQIELEKLKFENKEKQNTIEKQQITLKAISQSNEELVNEIDELNKEVNSNKIKEIQKRAQESQKMNTDLKNANISNISKTSNSDFRSLIKVKEKYIL